jgi:hypothetical protein
MTGLVSQLGVATVVFVSTNIDDILPITMLFADRALTPRASARKTHASARPARGRATRAPEPSASRC